MLNPINNSDYDTIGDTDKPGTSNDAVWSKVFKKLFLILTGLLVIIGLIYYLYYNGGNTLINNNNDVISIDDYSLSYPTMTCTSSGDSDLDANNYDKTLIWDEDIGYFLSGMLSTHSNFYEDRLFAIDYCRVDGVRTYGMFTTLSTTRYDEEFEWIRGCGGRSGLYYAKTIHDNQKEDRTFEFKCAILPRQYVFDDNSCQWSDYLADFDGKIDYNCPDNGIIRTMQSVHSNFHQDRRFKFECCRIANDPGYQYTHVRLGWSDDYTNQYRGKHNNYREGYYLYGLNSIHDNGYEDRRFKWSYIKLFSDEDEYESTASLEPTDYDVTWSRSCNNVNNGDAALVSAYSVYDNFYKDRKWSLTCGLLDRNKYQLANCGWTGYLNNYDEEIDFVCLGYGVIRGIASTHDNFFEDRLYKFECCEFIKSQL